MARSNLTLRLQLISRALITGALFNAWLPAQASNCAPQHISESVSVQYVHDGDTIRLSDGRKVRLVGINTPELAHKNQAEQAFAKQARLKLMALLRNSDYRVMLETGLEHKDKYQRTLAHIYLPDGTNIQQAMLESGLATAYTTPPNSKQSGCYKQAELKAQKAGSGLWKLPEYQIKSVGSLNRWDRGFRLIQGRVSHISSDHKGTRILLENRVRLSIAKSDLMYFPPGFIQSLKSKTIVVRGWLHPQKSQFFMSLRHPDAIAVNF